MYQEEADKMMDEPDAAADSDISKSDQADLQDKEAQQAKDYINPILLTEHIPVIGKVPMCKYISLNS